MGDHKMSEMFSLLNYLDRAERMSYEKLLYQKYSETPEGWIINNCKVVGDRLIPPYHYKDLIIYVGKENGKIKASLTLMKNYKNPYVLERMGFSVEKNSESLEGLMVCSEATDLLFLIDLIAYAEDDLKQKGYKEIFGAVAKKFVNVHYFYFDWHFLDEQKMVDKEERFLLHKTIA